MIESPKQLDSSSSQFELMTKRCLQLKFIVLNSELKFFRVYHQKFNMKKSSISEWLRALIVIARSSRRTSSATDSSSVKRKRLKRSYCSIWKSFDVLKFRGLNFRESLDLKSLNVLDNEFLPKNLSPLRRLAGKIAQKIVQKLKRYRYI